LFQDNYYNNVDLELYLFNYHYIYNMSNATVKIKTGKRKTTIPRSTVRKVVKKVSSNQAH